MSCILSSIHTESKNSSLRRNVYTLMYPCGSVSASVNILYSERLTWTCPLVASWWISSNFWNPWSGYYPGLPFALHSLMDAHHPWCGHYNGAQITPCDDFCANYTLTESKFPRFSPHEDENLRYHHTLLYGILRSPYSDLGGGTHEPAHQHRNEFFAERDWRRTARLKVRHDAELRL